MDPRDEMDHEIMEGIIRGDGGAQPEDDPQSHDTNQYLNLENENDQREPAQLEVDQDAQQTCEV